MKVITRADIRVPKDKYWNYINTGFSPELKVRVVKIVSNTTSEHKIIIFNHIRRDLRQVEWYCTVLPLFREKPVISDRDATVYRYIAIS